jgi:ABC-type antimicrobial peptide transport system permease subunit
VFQSELIISEAAFVRAFGQQAGYRVLLIDTPAERAAAATGQVEHALSGFGVDVSSTAARLAEYHQVENTYLSTFQTLGGLGLLLGTIGLAAIVLRNVLERRRELALLRAVGYRDAKIVRLLLLENAFLCVAGLAAGAIPALLAVAPLAQRQPAAVPWTSLLGTLTVVLVIGVGVAAIVVRPTLRAPLLPALRGE